MEKAQNHVTERMLTLTLEIIYQLTGENYVAFKLSDGLMATNPTKTLNPIIEVLSYPKRKNNKKVQEVTSEMIELLMGEVPSKCQDFSVCFSMEEKEHSEGHKDATECQNQLSPSSLDGSSNKNPQTDPLYSQDSAQELQIILRRCQDENIKNATNEVKEEAEEACVRGDEPCSEDEEEMPAEISTDTRVTQGDVKTEDEEDLHVKIEEEEFLPEIDTDGQNNRDDLDVQLVISSDGDIDDGDITSDSSEGNPITPNLHPAPSGPHPSYDPSTDGGSFPYQSPPVTHQKEGDTFPYSDFGQCFSQSAEIISHQFIYTEEKPYSCSECGKCFALKKYLINHQAIHKEEKPYSCSECGKCFSRRKYLTRHKRLHTGEKPYTCLDCGKTFTWRANFLTHQRTHNGVKPYSCSECGKCFSQRRYLMSHQIIHTGMKPFSCPECRKCFSERRSLIAHQMIHTGEKPYACSECGRCFTRRAHLVSHQLTHTGKRPYSCSECGKCFTFKAGLVSHQVTHSGETPYLCMECGKYFSRSAHLVAHQRTHTGEKPYSCPECGKFFSQSSSLAVHRKCHSEEKPFSCLQCGKCFKQKSSLLYHEKVHVGMKPVTVFEFSAESSVVPHLNFQCEENASVSGHSK